MADPDPADSLHLPPYVMRPGVGPVDVVVNGPPMGKRRDRVRPVDAEASRRAQKAMTPGPDDPAFPQTFAPGSGIPAGMSLRQFYIAVLGAGAMANMELLLRCGDATGTGNKSAAPAWAAMVAAMADALLAQTKEHDDDRLPQTPWRSDHP